jgi:hypothetical protein
MVYIPEVSPVHLHSPFYTSHSKVPIKFKLIFNHSLQKLLNYAIREVALSIFIW